MELFPAHPDLQLQISPPPATKPMELGFWKRALDTTSPATTTAAAAAVAATTAPSLSFASSAPTTAVGFHAAAGGHHHHQAPGSHFGLPFLHHTQPILPEGGGGGGLRDLASMRPIRGIPVYNISQPLPFLQSHPHHHHHHQHCYDAIAGMGHSGGGPRSPKAAALRLAGAPAKRGARAPRMRWTTSLHARFVHAVELLGGHEKKASEMACGRRGTVLATTVAVAFPNTPAAQLFNDKTPVERSPAAQAGGHKSTQCGDMPLKAPPDGAWRGAARWRRRSRGGPAGCAGGFARDRSVRHAYAHAGPPQQQH
uniref:Uncharacterized protein n=1 Tax=Setaria italica TaxID=4555 RepID=K3Z0Z9_SETIT